MQKRTLQFLLQGIGAPLSADVADTEITDVITDSRKVVPGCLFVATKGERTDTHDLLPEIFEKGAVFAVVDHLVEDAPQKKQHLVPHTLQALISIGANYRNTFNPVIAGITGSVGKTTTKEFTYAAISKFGKTLKSIGNKNTEYGMTETLLNLDETFEYAVIEMGMSAKGDISLLTKAARPNIALITNIAPVHIKDLGTLENILETKLEICEGLTNGSTIAINKDDELLKNADIPNHVNVAWYALEDKTADVTAQDVEEGEYGQNFTIVDKEHGEHKVYIPTLGHHTLLDALGAYTLVTRLGMPAKETAEGLASYEPAGQRQKVVKYKDITVIEDCYNANIYSMQAGVETLMHLPGTGKRIAVLGDMLELADFAEGMHTQVGQMVAEKGVDVLYTFGQDATFIHANAAKGGKTKCIHFTSKQELANVLKETTNAGDVVLFKASRGMQFEDIIEMFYAE